MSMEYIRKTYGVPAKRGAEIVYHGGDCDLVGVITGTSGARLRVRFDGSRHRKMILHPTWCVRYLTLRT